MGRWNGTHLRFVSPRSFPPFLTRLVDRDGRITLYGIFGSLMSNLTSVMGITYEVTVTSDGEYGLSHSEPDKFTGMLRSLLRNEADVAVSGFFPDPNIFKHLRYVPYTHQTWTVMWTGMRTAFETTPTPYVKAFEAPVWLLLSLSIIVLTLFHSLEAFVLRQQRLGVREIFENFLRVSQSLLQEASKNRYSGTDRILGGAWMLATYVLMQYFTGDLKANSVLQSPTLRINTVEDVYAHRKTHRLMYPIQTPVEDDLRAFKGELLEKMEIVLREGVPLRVEQYFKPEDLMLLVEEKAVLSGEEWGTSYAISHFCKTTDKFYYKSDEGFPRHYFAMVMASHLEKDLTDEINRRILIITSMGVPFVSSRDVHPGGWSCVVTDRNNVFAADPLGFADMLFTLMSHLVALSMCVAVLAAEICHSMYSNWKLGFSKIIYPRE
ncbi:uncharacterized protein LOC108863857 [Galendromus occidentalis]|uniref:Uncharacterized protein LOC108863857 n=1 Tax=Galendromus occidentalis TaxID=34638 RepID=A0AAJ7P969_9ACAR|nr:uncharacterized protein LOC108863857 [Galendromus occidentalis]